jgi:hypothetical protein
MTPGAAQFEEATFSEADPARPRTTNGSGVAYDERARIFACGDVRSGSVKRVASAVGEGSLAIAFSAPAPERDRTRRRRASWPQRRLLRRSSGRGQTDLVQRSTNRATKLRDSTRTESTSSRLNKPQKLEQTSSSRYRTQEVAGSSPASSTPQRVPAFVSPTHRSVLSSTARAHCESVSAHRTRVQILVDPEQVRQRPRQQRIE